MIRNNMIKNNFSHLEKAIETIEKCIQKRMRPIEISTKLKAESMLNYKYFNEVFNKTTGYTLGKYIKRRALTIVFEKWKQDGKNLCANSTYGRFERFSKKFFEEFNITIEDAAQKDYTEKQLQEKIDISRTVMLLEALDQIEKLKLVDGYKFKNKEEINLQFNNSELLYFYLQMPVYILRYQDYLYYEARDYEQKVLAIAAFDKLYRAKCAADKVLVTEEEYYGLHERICHYDFHKIDELFVVRPKEIKSLKRIFCEMCGELLPYIVLNLPECLMPRLIAMELHLIDESKSIAELSELLKKNREETMDLLWEYLICGFLRIM